MSRTTVPKRSAISYGTLVTDFNDSVQINVAGTRTNPLDAEEGVHLGSPPNTGALVDTAHFLSGSSGVHVQVYDATNADTLASVRTNIAMDLSLAKALYLWVYRGSETDNTSPDNADLTVGLRGYTDAFGVVTNRYQWADIAGAIAARNQAPAGWVLYCFDLGDQSEVGSPTGLDQIQWFSLEIEAAGSGVNDVECWVDSMYIDMRARPKVLLSIDDGFASDKTEVYDYMQPKGMLATSNIISSTMSGGAELTEADAITMYGNGWDMCDHSSDATIPAVIAKFNICRDYLNSLGFTRSSDFIAYPGNGIDNDLISDVASAGYKAARGRIGSTSGGTVAPPHIGHPDSVDQWPFNKFAFPFSISFDSSEYGASGATIKADIDAAIKSGRTCIIMMHEVVASGATGNQTDRADFRDIVDYIETKMHNGECDIVTMSQWYEGLTSLPRALDDRIAT